MNINYKQLFTFSVIWLVSLYLLFMVLTSCSATNLMRRAIKKDPSIVKTDTVIVDRIIEGDKGATAGVDSVIVNNERVYIKALANGKIDLLYIVKDVIIHDTTNIISIVAPASRQEVRQDAKTERKKVKQQGKTNRHLIKWRTKTVTKTNLNLLYIGIAIGLFLKELGRYITKRFFR